MRRWYSAAFAGKSPAGADNAPCWHGEDPAGKTILLTTEQGMGDVIQFIRDWRWILPASRDGSRLRRY